MMIVPEVEEVKALLYEYSEQHPEEFVDMKEALKEFEPISLKEYNKLYPEKYSPINYSAISFVDSDSIFVINETEFRALSENSRKLAVIHEFAHFYIDFVKRKRGKVLGQRHDEGWRRIFETFGNYAGVLSQGEVYMYGLEGALLPENYDTARGFYCPVCGEEFYMTGKEFLEKHSHGRKL